MSIIEQAIRRMRESADPAPPQRSVVPPPLPNPANASTAVEVTAHAQSVNSLRPRRVVTLNVPELRAAGLLAPAEQEKLIARQYRRIKLPLIARARAKGDAADARNHLIMVSSALPGEGKTFSSVNLALSLARELDTEVVLIDADVAKPHISQAFGVAGERGLVDALTDPSAPLESLILPTNVERLSVLPAGRFSEESATELLSSARMQQVMARIGSLRRNVIAVLDTPPLLLTTESVVIAGLVGQIVMVVGAAKTPRAAVLDALSRLPEGRQIGVVLNRARVSPSETYSNYTDYGSYGSYGVYGSTADGGASDRVPAGAGNR